MTITKALVAAILAGACCSISVSARAQSQMPPGATMLAPGVYTTPEISAKCQKYARERVGTSANTDSARQSVALACAKKLWNKQMRGQQVRGTR
jgi:hypothetical protein